MSESPEALRREAARDPLGLMKRIGCRAILFMKDDQRSITLKWAFRVFGDFRETLRLHRAPVESSSSLPHPRKDIEAALFILLLQAILAGEKEKAAVFRKTLRSLARFADIAEEDRGMVEPALRVTADPSLSDSEKHLQEERLRHARTVLERYAASVRGEEERLVRKERDLLGIYGR
jgi:hypothetical protein